MGGRILGISRANSHYINVILSREVSGTSVNVKSAFISKYKIGRVIRQQNFTVVQVQHPIIFLAFVCLLEVPEDRSSNILGSDFFVLRFIWLKP